MLSRFLRARISGVLISNIASVSRMELRRKLIKREEIIVCLQSVRELFTIILLHRKGRAKPCPNRAEIEKRLSRNRRGVKHARSSDVGVAF